MPRGRRRATESQADDTDLIGGPGVGHNGGPSLPVAESGSADQIASEQLLEFVERLEDIAERRADLAEESRDTLAEAKSAGFDTAQIKRVIALRKLEREERDAQRATLDLYLEALGMI